MNGINNNFQAFEPENEVKAFIYQQVQDLENLTKDLGSLAVFVEKEHALDQEVNYQKFAVTFVVAPESINLEIRTEGPDIFEACVLAKQEAQKKLNSFINAVAEQEARTTDEENKGWLH